MKKAAVSQRHTYISYTITVMNNIFHCYNSVIIAKKSKQYYAMLCMPGCETDDKFLCPTSGECIRDTDRCNGVPNDCSQNEDEHNCSK